jgi:hypothetical protein
LEHSAEARVLLTYKSWFTRTGITNIQSEHVWSDENPHAIRFHRQQMTVLLWDRILGDSLKGPHILPARFTGSDYFNFLRTHLSGLLEDVSLSTRLHVWFQREGAPPHYSGEVHQWLSENYPGGWIGHGCESPVLWPARSPDLNLLDPFLWEYLKIRFCASTDDI